ncbi:efflux transporter outer membrane subunit [Parasphingopyxis lamellibrachiae]|uniref:NodT family efflux transporter outer membrane factor (OMF) lipoprotein n=1 Tax=Parasphingopyxis lamellibrachiae TaxID=680125 RepID=A0A3D9FL60_9SPHN|nr:efflux transporter outer membrane subunit [Parasphingopyxis lamellibrachiae]RED17801.1 NodT family efflux transporter outer membrane factor (OMF) lipoprotein [Parasphingopyxis lamellibrachiae]
MRFRSSFILTILAIAPACTVGPDYERPELQVGSDWMEPAILGSVDQQWWDNFNDPMLSRLVEMAIADSPQLREAEARLAEARANRDAALGGRLPQTEASGAVSENVVSENGQFPVGEIPGFARDFSLFDLGFDASWEIDFWGRHTRQIEGAQARAEAALEARRGVLVTLIGEVARAYVDLRVAQAEQESLANVAQAETVRADLTGQRFQGGESSRLEWDQATYMARVSAQAVPEAEGRVAAAAYRIATLIGSSPEAIVPDLLRPGPVPESPEQILAGLRSELMTRRPDIRRAERELAAATADIGVATADLFPRFSLFGSLGQQARNTGDLLSGGSTRLSIGPSFSWPIFSGGRIRAQIRGADARAEAAAARYEAAVIGALSDSEGSINRFLRMGEAEEEAMHAYDRQQSVFRFAEQRHQAGEDDALVLAAARRALAEAGIRLERVRGDRARSAITLYKSLGGGWISDPESQRTLIH